MVCFDTQIQSYLCRNLNNNKNQIPNSISQIVKLINKRRCKVDCVAYIFENALFNPKFLDSETFKENNLAFETYFYRSKSSAKRSADKISKDMHGLIKSDFANYYRRQYKLYYLELLVMVDIYLNNSNFSIYDKELKMAKYFHENIGLIPARELNLAKLFFMYGTKIKFFGKIQKGRNDLIKSLKNMAWDIFHIQNTLNNIFIQSSSKVEFTIPIFITYDRRLKEILPIYQIKSVAFVKHSTEKHTNYCTDLLDPTISNKYLCAKAFLERQEKTRYESEKSLIKTIDLEINKFEKLLET